MNKLARIVGGCVAIFAALVFIRVALSPDNVSAQATPTAFVSTTDDTATITGSLDRSGIPTVNIFYQIDGTTGAPLQKSGTVDSNDGFSETLTGLAKGTKYVFWIKAPDGTSLFALDRFETTGGVVSSADPFDHCWLC